MNDNERQLAPPLPAAEIAAKINAAQALLARAKAAEICTKVFGTRVSIPELGRRVVVGCKDVEDDQLNAALRQAIEDRAQEFITSLIDQAQRLLAEAAGVGDE